MQRLLASLKSCSRSGDLASARGLHAEASECGYASSIYIASSLINMYAKCGSMVDAHLVFDAVQHPNAVLWNVLILGYADNGQGLASLYLLARMNSEGFVPDSLTFVAALKACTSLVGQGLCELLECRKRGKKIHNLAYEYACDSSIFVQNTLIDMYAKCGSMEDAWEVFSNMEHPDVVSWTALLRGYADNGQGLTALNLFARMKSAGVAPNSVTLVAVSKACTSLLDGAASSGLVKCSKRGKMIYNLALENCCSLDSFVQNTLLDMYCKCRSVADARQVFDSMKRPDVVSWTTLILGYADTGEALRALDLLMKMKTGGLAPDSVTLVAALKACTSLAVEERATECAEWSYEIHKLAVKNGWSSDIYVQSTLINLYAKCGKMVDARQVFDSMKRPDLVSWTALVLGYADNGLARTALEMFLRMKSAGPVPDSVMFSAVLKACALLGALEFGRRVHSEVGDEHLGVVLLNCLVDFYAKCGSLAEAQSVFGLNTEKRDVITWNALLAGFGNCGEIDCVFELFRGMQEAGLRPDSVTLLSLLTCCSHAGLVDKGKECFDAMATKYGILPTVEHYTCMVDILGRSNKLHDAMALLQGMTCSPNEVTWMTVLAACRKCKNVEIARLAVECLIDFSHHLDAAYALVGQIYAMRGMLHEAQVLVGMRTKLKDRGEASWTSELGQVHFFLVL